MNRPCRGGGSIPGIVAMDEKRGPGRRSFRLQTGCVLREPRFWLLLLSLGYFAFVTLSHYWVSEIYGGIFRRFGRAAMEGGLQILSLAVAGAAGLALLGMMWRRRKPPAREAVLWAGALGLLAAGDWLLVSTRIERIHYPQYAILALLLGPVIQDDWAVLIGCTLLGAVDELVQFAWAPHYTGYLDFNDMLLNLAGALCGLLIRRAVVGARGRAEKVRRAGCLVAFAVAGAVLLGVWARVIVPYAPVKKPVAVIGEFEGRRAMALSFVDTSKFWHTTDYGRRYHIFSPLEGGGILGAVLGFQWVLFSWVDRSFSAKMIDNRKV